MSGGLGGVMEAASRGARSRGGATIGILPGSDPDEANGWVLLVIPTGLGEARNALIVRDRTRGRAIGGGYGTLSEIALALRRGQARDRHRDLGRARRRRRGGRRGRRRPASRSRVVTSAQVLRRRGGPLSPDRA